MALVIFVFLKQDPLNDHYTTKQGVLSCLIEGLNSCLFQLWIVVLTLAVRICELRIAVLVMPVRILWLWIAQVVLCLRRHAKSGYFRSGFEAQGYVCAAPAYMLSTWLGRQWASGELSFVWLPANPQEDLRVDF